MIEQEAAVMDVVAEKTPATVIPGGTVRKSGKADALVDVHGNAAHPGSARSTTVANLVGIAANTSVLGAVGSSKIRSSVQVVDKTSAPHGSISLDLLSVFSCFLLVHAAYLNGLNFTSYRTVALFSAVSILMLALSASGIYQTKRPRGLRDELAKLVVSWLCAFAVIGLFAFLSKTAEEVSRVWMSASMVSSLILLAGTRVFRCTVFKVGAETRKKNVVLYGSADRIRETVQALSASPDSRIRIVRSFEHHPAASTAGGPAMFREDVAQQSIDFIERKRQAEAGGAIEQVWIALPAEQSKCVEELSDRLSDSSVDVCVVPDRYTDRLLDGETTRIGQVRVVNVSDVSLSPAADQLKRVFDSVISLIALIFLSIPMLVIAACIRFESPGAVIFRQKRYGVDGKEIEVWKFRSMYMHDDGKVRQAVRGDVRVTPLGRILRSTSLDELPQLFNVLQGSMSLVGPRPHAVAHNELWRHQIRGYMLRHKVRPGITGWAQINGWRGETDTSEKMEQRVSHDLSYIRNWSIWLDIRILFLTVFKGFYNKNAY